MNDAFPLIDANSAVGAVETATVIDTSPEGTEVQVRRPTSHPPVCWARCAASLPQTPQMGDQVLLADNHDGDQFVIALLTATRPHPRRVVSSTGAYAESTVDEYGNDTICIRADDDSLLLQYNPRDNSAKITSNAKHVQITSSTGDLSLRSAGRMHLSAQQVEITSRHGIRLMLVSVKDAIRTLVDLVPGKLALRGKQVECKAEQGDFEIAEAKVHANQVECQTKQMRVQTKRMEIDADTVISSARNIYQRVQELSQLQVGRFRAIVAKTCHWRAKKTYLSSEEDFKINGDKIHLG